MCCVQTFSGLFRGPFILQTLTYHLTAISGHVKIPGLCPADTIPLPRGALGMAASAVSNVLFLS